MKKSQVQNAMKKAQEYAEARFAVMERVAKIRYACDADHRRDDITMVEAQECFALAERFGIRY